VILGAALSAGLYFGPAYYTKITEPTIVPLKTGGTSNVDIIVMNSWRSIYRNTKGVDIKYDSTGSTKGISGVMDNQFSIAFTHAPLSEEQKLAAKAKGNPILQIPMILCAVVPTYNIKDLNDKPPLKFTGDVLAEIFMGDIDRWDHPKLKELN